MVKACSPVKLALMVEDIAQSFDSGIQQFNAEKAATGDNHDAPLPCQQSHIDACDEYHRASGEDETDVTFLHEGMAEAIDGVAETFECAMHTTEYN